VGPVDIVRRPTPTPEWFADATCRVERIPTETFFPAFDDHAGVAIAICARCPVRECCLEWAIAERFDAGIFGGTTARGRMRIRRRRRERRAS
jgi:WhiB family redox-sensing transcriptional regulator